MGALPTVMLIPSISLFGARFVRTQGFAIFRRIQVELERGRLPAGELLDGALILVGGVLAFLRHIPLLRRMCAGPGECRSPGR